MRKLFVFVMALAVLAGTSLAQKKAKPADAESMVKKAIAFIKASGKDAGLAEISNPKGKFVDGELYVFVYDMTGKCLAHGGNPKMIGKDLIDMKDADGKSFVQERIDLAKSKGKGWQNYKWSNPVSKQIEDKVAYIEKVDDFIVGSGAYK
jgi:cytochrome c